MQIIQRTRDDAGDSGAAAVREAPSDGREDRRDGPGRRAGNDFLPVLAGAAVGVGGVGAALALVDADSVLRAPFTLFFLLAAPAAALAAALPRLDPLSRTVVAVIGAMAVDLLVAQVMIATRVWSARGGVVAVGALSLTLLLLALARLRRSGRARQDR